MIIEENVSCDGISFKKSACCVHNILFPSQQFTLTFGGRFIEENVSLDGTSFKKSQGGHNVRNYGIYGIVKKMYGIVRNENRCTVRTKMCTDVRNSEKGHITSFRFFQYTQL